jgi:hypothetical protein
MHTHINTDTDIKTHTDTLSLCHTHQTGVGNMYAVLRTSSPPRGSRGGEGNAWRASGLAPAPAGEGELATTKGLPGSPAPGPVEGGGDRRANVLGEWSASRGDHPCRAHKHTHMTNKAGETAPELRAQTNRALHTTKEPARSGSKPSAAVAPFSRPICLPSRLPCTRGLGIVPAASAASSQQRKKLCPGRSRGGEGRVKGPGRRRV